MKQKTKRFDPEAEEKRRQRKVLIFSIFMVALMVFSIAEVIVNQSSSTSNQLTYGKYEFVFKDQGNGYGVYTTTMNGQTIEFQSLPVQVTDLQVDPQAIQALKNGQQIAFTADTNLSSDVAGIIDYARLQLTTALPNSFNAMTYNDTRYKLPVVNCAMANQLMPVVTFNISNETGITADGDCITINGEASDFLRLKDRLLFEYYGILQNGTVPQS